MCGITGYISKKRIEDALFGKMNDSMYHRGPDDSGVDVFEGRGGYFVGMAQRRLSILDLSAAGHQPMWDNNERYCIAFNGEIYNFKDIRTDLEKNGYVFKSDSDTEVLLYAYIEYKASALNLFNGMFAFAVYDKEEGTLFIARDRIGKKPLYYYINNGDFMFASELKPIMMSPLFKRELNEAVLSRYLAHGYIASPDTIFKNTFKLAPGEWGMWNGETFIKEKYWDVSKIWGDAEDKRADKRDINTYKEGLRDLLTDSVKKRLISDVPVGAFLSGGIDSSIVCAIANQLKPGGIDTFSIGFEDEKYNEAPFAKEVAEHLSTHHHELIMTEKQLFDTLGDMIKYYDEPFGDSSQLPMMLVSGFARKKVTVSLSGDGGDELFCGYKAYDEIVKYKHYQPIANIAQLILPEHFIASRMDERFASVLNNGRHGYYVQGSVNKRGYVGKRLLKDPTLVSYMPVSYELEKHIGATDWKEKRMLLDTMTYMPDDILQKTDRASMRYSLEVRCPILDHRFVEYAFSIPLDLKYKDGEKKYILKELLYDYAPKEIFDRPKRGFGVPLTRWLRTLLKEKVRMYSKEEAIKKQGLFSLNGIDWLKHCVETQDRYNYSAVLWNFLVFQMWYQEYIEDLWN